MVNLPDYKKIHCIGIGGIGLSAIAEILMSRGYQVSGSDMRESEMTEKLMKDGADIFLGHRAKNVRSEENTSELQSLMRISYAVFCLKTKKKKTNNILK